ncbi:N-acetyltransferase [Mangrovimonas sp. CR14]|uniref:GNAT family N-acetyltransferase n=1 Tax=Mangrovimonas sp. CR14 TaxID=2706120 RepID=UPI00141FC968|nr:GNAT family N-acetyltransferase [Mangrovimonas sp. CR14]NIK93587.1 N-acetyltransferase [Mangrovimonas sp. CR14]
MNFRSIDKHNYPQVADIYQMGILTGMATFETEVPSYELWDSKHLPFCRLTLNQGDRVIGWAALSAVSSREVYRGVAEVSIYVHPDFQGNHAGTQLLNHIISESETHHIWTLQCGIMEENKASIALHKKCGFREIGYRERIGCLHGQWKNNIIFERRSPKTGI